MKKFLRILMITVCIVYVVLSTYVFILLLGYLIQGPPGMIPGSLAILLEISIQIGIRTAWRYILRDENCTTVSATVESSPSPAGLLVPMDILWKPLSGRTSIMGGLDSNQETFPGTLWTRLGTSTPGSTPRRTSVFGELVTNPDAISLLKERSGTLSEMIADDSLWRSNPHGNN